MHRAPAENFTVASLAAMQVPQLKELCQQRGMPIKAARLASRCNLKYAAYCFLFHSLALTFFSFRKSTSLLGEW